MNPAHRDGWSARPPGSTAHHHLEGEQQAQAQAQAHRPNGPYGAAPPQPSPHSQPGGMPQSSGHFVPYQQSSHNLPPLLGAGQGSPRAPGQSHPPPPGPRHSGAYPPIPESRPAYLDSRDRAHEAREREAREVHIKEEQDAAARRERDIRERQILDQMQPQQNQGGPLQLHQPIAVGPRTVHGPNGLLGNPAAAGPPLQALGGPPGPPAPGSFSGQPMQAGPPPPTQSSYLAPPQAGAPPPGQPPVAAAIPQPANPTPSPSQTQGQGQQPILNDALSYLDQVKIQFHESPDVYNRFLDIMKDFKSGAIDTPGVIDRVSGLFAGNPDLIQGFNTFLPPGYRIEAGTGDDPNAIRVTTPLGHTVVAMPSGHRHANGTWTPQPGQTMFSPSGRPVGPATVSAQLAAQAAQANGDAGQHPEAVEKQGLALAEAEDKKEPVEFNHAINYVNKIKNRFSSQPDIYKSFLDILQTYQRESRPIQEVYNQVTKLFEAAPDLLDDFKQFLPDTTSKAKDKARRHRKREDNIPISNMRGEPSSAQLQKTPRADRLPPVGNFAPTPLKPDQKRKRGDTKTGAHGVGPLLGEGVKGDAGSVNGVKRAKHGSVSQGGRDVPVSPTLVPALPEPLPPTSRSAATNEELGFFDRVKKTISNKGTMNEFLKLCNLFSQDLIDKTTLVHRARSFIGSNPELYGWFQKWVGYEDQDALVIENRARPPTGRVMLSNCRGLGPSYRLLPKRERQKPCSGRDELCHSVLNDDWASHPTWASEDSGFIAHRKNVHEEGLHKIEEERHDYDFHIEACSRTIQLLEPFAQQLLRMSEKERENLEIPPGIGGQSETIHKRIIKKVYGREDGRDVIAQLHKRPYAVIPVILNRLKQKLEEWKTAQREWEKVWRDQTQKIFWKSLDHQAVNAKAADKRQFQTKTLLGEIQTRYEEQKKQRLHGASYSQVTKPQMLFSAADEDVVSDAACLVLIYADQYHSTDYPRLTGFVKEFVPLFFGYDVDWFNSEVRKKLGAYNGDDMADEVMSNYDEPSGPRKKTAGRKDDLRRGVLDRANKNGRAEGGNTPYSRATTPDNASHADEEMSDAAEALADDGAEVANETWAEYPTGANTFKDKNITLNEPHRRSEFSLFGNASIYCFVRMFVILYERLSKLKESEAEVQETVRRAVMIKPAIDLGLVDKQPSDFFENTGPGANYYHQVLGMIKDFIQGNDVDLAQIEETLRRYYLACGWQLYSVDKLLSALVRFAIGIMGNDSRDKSWELLTLFRKDRAKEESTVQEELSYRRQAERLIREGDMYKITYDQDKQEISMKVFKHDEPTFDATRMQQEDAWRIYVHEYVSSAPTPGTRMSDVSMPILRRGIRELQATAQQPVRPTATAASSEAAGATGEDGAATPGDKATSTSSNHNGGGGERLERRFDLVRARENLEFKIAVGDYKMQFVSGQDEFWHQPGGVRLGGADGARSADRLPKYREDKLQEKFASTTGGLLERVSEEREKGTRDWELLVDPAGPPAATATAMEES